MQLKYKEILSRYLPAQTLNQVTHFLVAHKIQIKITRNRNSKLGDYRPPGKVKAHRITINGDLQPYYFYLVFLHELAHLLVWDKYQNRVKPHGNQWKEEFGSLLKYATHNNYFPTEMQQIVWEFSNNVKATFASDAMLWRFLNQESGGEENLVLEDIPDDSYFEASNGRIFKKAEKLRKRYRCFCLNNKRQYLFHPFANVRLLEEQDLKLV